MNPTEMLVLRLLHISSGVFWAGAVIFMAAFIIPASSAAGSHGGKFMQKLMGTKLPMWMMVASIINILAGFRLMWLVSTDFSADWFGTGTGISLTIGAVAAIIAIVVGMSVNRPAAAAMDKVAKAIGDNPPTAEQAAEVGVLRKKLASGSNMIAILLSLAVIFMSIARYAGVIFG